MQEEWKLFYRVYCVVAVAALATANLGASVIGCSLNGGGAPAGGCYSALSFAGNDSLDWGSAQAFGEAFTPQTGNGQNNPHDVGSSSSPTPWIAQSNLGLGVGVSMGAGAQYNYISRVDNAAYAWNGPAGDYWDFPNTVSQAEYGQNILTYAGHFEGPPTGDPSGAYNPGKVEFGAHLIAPTNGAGVVTGGGPMILTFTSSITSVGFRISTNGNNANTNFDATVAAYDSQGNILGTYSIVDQGDGGICAGLTPSPTVYDDPAACNDAPWIGFVAPTSQIKSISVEAFGSNGTTPLSYMIDTLDLNTAPNLPTPEPTAAFLIEGGLVALSLYGKRAGRMSRRWRQLN